MQLLLLVRLHVFLFEKSDKRIFVDSAPKMCYNICEKAMSEKK